MIIRIRPSRLMPLISLGFLGILILQLTRSMYIDSFAIVGSRLDLIGYIANYFLGFFLLAYAWQKKILRVNAIFIFIVFIGLLAINVEFNSQESYKSIIFSRFGVLTWLLMGIWVSLSLSNISNLIGSGQRGLKILLSQLWIYLVSLPAGWFVYEILLTTPKGAYYQAVATSGILIICSSVLALFAMHKNSEKKTPKLLGYIYLVLSSFLVYAIALLQSTGIIAFWLIAMPIIVFSLKSQSRYKWHIPLGIITIAIIAMISTKYMANDLVEKTRFTYATYGIVSVSSVKNRLDLLPEFLPQFYVAPVFGDYEAEVVAGYLKGEYVHSLPLSLLTHTGVFGFGLFVLGWLTLYLSEIKQNHGSDVWLILRFRLFIAITVLATFYAFFTWQVIWFFIGMMCVKKSPNNTNEYKNENK